MRLFLVLLLTIMSPFLLYCQSRDVTDSLKIFLSNLNSSQDSLKLQAYRKLIFHNPNSKEALLYVDSALILAKKLNNKLFIVQVEELKGMHHRLLGNKQKSLSLSIDALKVYTELNMPLEQAHIQLQVGEFFFEDEDYSSAIEYMSQSVCVFESSGKNYRTAKVYINLGEAYRLNNQLQESEYYSKKALKTAKKLNRRKEIIIAYATGNLGLVYGQQQNYDSALINLNVAISILEDLRDNYSVAIYKAERGVVLIKQGYGRQGESDLIDALAIAQSENIKKTIRDVSKALSDYYSSEKMYKEAFGYQKLFQIYQDSLVNAENIKKTEQIMSRYELDKRDLEIDNLQVENELSSARFNQVLIAVVLLTLLAIVLYVSYYYKKRANVTLKQKNNIIEQQIREKELLHQEVHHRVKNNLQLIGSIMGLQSKSSESEEVSVAIAASKSRVEAVTVIHESLFTENYKTQVNLKHYLERLVSNLTATYRDQLQEIILQVAPIDISADQAIPIGLIVNEAVCNTIKYRCVNMAKVTINLVTDDENYKLTIEDFGNLTPNGESYGDGFGSKLINILTKQLSAKLDVKHESEGSYIEMIIPKFIMVS